MLVAFAFTMLVAVFLLMAFAVFAVIVAIGHFGFHVAKQLFGFFVFSLFAQFIDFVFGLLDELTRFLVLFTFVAFALAIAFAVVLMVALAVVGAVTLTAVTSARLLRSRFSPRRSVLSVVLRGASRSWLHPGRAKAVARATMVNLIFMAGGCLCWKDIPENMAGGPTETSPKLKYFYPWVQISSVPPDTAPEGSSLSRLAGR
jgi:prepilin signal peptidase PulO-like enzyme (type II secretory pathway)